MANVLNEEKKQQVSALGRAGMVTAAIQLATHIRSETARQYLKAAGIAVQFSTGMWRRNKKAGSGEPAWHGS